MFKCSFPNCDYETENRSQIHYHHIIPKELNGSDRPFNRVFFCPNCHNKVYIEGSTGIHSVKRSNSIIIKGKLKSTDGTIIHYILENEENFYKERT